MTTDEVKQLNWGDIICFKSNYCNIQERIGKVIDIDKNHQKICIAWENLRYKDEYLFGNWYDIINHTFMWQDTFKVTDQSLIDNFNKSIKIYVENIENNLNEFKKRVFFENI